MSAFVSHRNDLYEALSSVVIFALLWRLRARLSAIHLFALYLVLGGLERFLVDFMRRNEHVWLGLNQPQLFAAAMVLARVALLAWWPLRRRALPAPAPSV